MSSIMATLREQMEEGEDLVLVVGRYSFDKNPFIGVIADLSVWDR